MFHPVVSASRWKKNILAFTTKTEPLTVVGGGGNVRLSSHGSRLGRCSTVALVLKTAYDTRGELCSRSVVLAEAKTVPRECGRGSLGSWRMPRPRS